MNSVTSSLKYQKPTTLDCENKGIRKIEFVAKTAIPLTKYEYQDHDSKFNI